MIVEALALRFMNDSGKSRERFRFYLYVAIGSAAFAYALTTMALSSRVGRIPRVLLIAVAAYLGVVAIVALWRSIRKSKSAD